MQVQHQTTEKNGRFFLEADGKTAAVMTYVFAGPDKFIIDHTEVFPGHEGQGLGKQLVQAAVDFAREKGLKIMPLCPFAKGVFAKTPAYADVLM